MAEAGTKRQAENDASTSRTKKQATNKSSDEDQKAKTPMEQLDDRLEEVRARDAKYGAILVQGLDSYDDDDEDEEEEDEGDEQAKKPKEYTEEQVATIRYFLCSKGMIKEFESANLFSCDTDGISMFNTQSGNNVICGLPKQIKSRMSRKGGWPARLEAMLALTISLTENDPWIMDNEMWEELEEVVKLLGKSWKGLLKHSDAELGIDPEFSRPAVITALEKFRELCESMPAFEEIEKPLSWE